MYVPLTDEQLIQVRDTLYHNLQVWDEQYVEVDVLMSEIAYWQAEVAKARVSSYVAHGDVGAARYDLRIVRAEAERLRAENAKLVESRRCWRMDAVGFGKVAKMYKAEAEKWEARHAALAEVEDGDG